MKKSQVIIFCISSIFLLALASNAAAYNADYTHTDYMASTAPTINGQYIANEEWAPSKSETFGVNGIWRDEWVIGESVFENILIETADNTDDAGDYWQICFDGSANGGTAPQEDDFRVDIVGHGASATVTWYKGTGTGWTAIASPPAAVFTYAQSFSVSPLISTQHYILEMSIDKQSTALGGSQILGQQFAMRIAYYDAHEGGNGLQEWPPAPATRDNPSGWGYIIYEMDVNPNPDVPENLGIIAVVGLSSVAVVAGATLLRKKSIVKI